MLSTYKRMPDIEKLLIHILLFLGISHIFIITLCFHFGFFKQLLLCMVSIVIWLLGICYIIFVHQYNTHSEYLFLPTWPKQLFIVSTICAAFVISAYISTYTNILFTARACFLWSFFISLSLVSGLCWIYTSYMKNPSFVSSALFQMKKKRMLWIVLMISFAARVGMLDTFQRWDAGEYYYALGNACANFDFYWENFFDNFRLCNHTTLGFSFLMSIGEFLNPRGITGVLCINLILTLYAIYCLYHLLVKMLSGNSHFAAGFITLICSLMPFFLGSFGYLTPDYVMAVTFILAICADYNKEYLLEFFWLAIAINTKETAIATIFGYFLFKLFYILINAKRNQRSWLCSIIKNATLWVALCSALLFLLILKLQGGFLWKGGTNISPIQFSNTKVNSFGIQIPYIIFRLKQHFILNFNWIITLILAICFLIWIIRQIRRSRSKSVENSDIVNLLFSICGALLFCLITNCLFITAGAYRYNTVFLPLYSMFALTIYWELIGVHIKNWLSVFIYLPLSALMFIEAFIHIDPVSAHFFTTRSTGNWYTVMTNFTHTAYGNDLCNNYQYTWLDSAFNKMLENINYDGSQEIIIVGGQEQGSQFKGNGSFYRVCWDSMRMKRVIFDEFTVFQNEALIPLNTTIINIEDAYNIENAQNNAVVFFIPYYEVNEDECLQSLSAFYHIGERQVINKFGGSLVYYTLSLK